MKKYWNAFVMCQSMFCSIPCPWKRWDEKARPYMLLFLPLVGLEIGMIWALMAWAAISLELPYLVTSAVLCLYPFFVTGFIHLDGFMDVTDAVRSWRDLERRREILKDSRVGAFAVIACGALMIMQFACAGSVAEAFGGLDVGFMAMPGLFGLSMIGVVGLCLVLIPVITRCCSALAVTALPAMSTSQYANDSKKKTAAIVLYVVLMVLILIFAFVAGGTFAAVPLGCMAGYAGALLRAYRSLKGMNGDISGYALTIGELCGLAVLALMI